MVIWLLASLEPAATATELAMPNRSAPHPNSNNPGVPSLMKLRPIRKTMQRDVSVEKMKLNTIKR